MAQPLNPTAAFASRALLPGDPGRALRLAQALLDKPLMANHARGLWGYTGLAADGEPLTVQATGLGGPSTAAVLEQLAELGVRTAIRVGTCRAEAGEPALGTVAAVGLARAQDGVSIAAGATSARPAPGLAGRLEVVSRDRLQGEPTLEAPLADRTTAPFLVVAAELGLQAGAVLIVSEGPDGALLDEPALHAAELEAGRQAAALLGIREASAAA